MKIRFALHFLFPTLFFITFIFSVSSCKVNYSMTGASISPDVKTITVKFFNKTATLGPATLSQSFTEGLKSKFLSQTSLSLVDREGDLVLEGTISGYTIQPLAIQANETAAQNRLTITVNAKFTNHKNEKQNFETSFTRYADYGGNQNYAVIEDELVREVTEQLIEDIFNKAIINW